MDIGELHLEGRRLADRYVLEEEVASGGMGTVWRATDGVLGRPVAVKVLHDHLARDEGVLDRFRLEAVAAARLSHPHVVRVFDTGIDDGVCFIVMELFEGRTLANLLAEDGPLPPPDAAHVVRGMLHALAHAHREGVVHRDVKPSNILVDRAGFVKVADFGIAKAAFAGDLTTTGSILGTARYLAPEQVSGGPVDGRTDLYGAGIVLYEALTGRVPFEADTHIATATMRLTKDPVPPGALRPGIPRALETVVMRALARDADDRFASAEEMSAALDRAVPTTPTERIEEPRLEPPPEPVASPSLFGRWIVVPLVLLALGALAVASFAVVSALLEEGGPAPAGAAAESPRRPLEAAAVSTFDPFGSDGEHDEDLGAATDGDRDTSWTTEGYDSPDLDKPGVGIVIELSEPAEVGAIRLRTDTPGFAFSLYAATEAGDFEPESQPPLVSTDGEDSFTADDGLTVELEPVETRYLLLWITELVPHDRYRAYVNEMQLFAPE